MARAIVHMPDGRVFEGEVSLDGDAVCMEGCLRSRRRVAGEETIVYGEAATWTWPLARIAAIHWERET
jgi:hypothetical protein